MEQGVQRAPSILAAAHPFAQAVALELRADGGFQGRPHPAYANMVGPFGGMTAAQMLQAVMLHPSRLGEPVALTVNFAAGLLDAPFIIQARPARTNRTTQHWIMALTQRDAHGAEVTMTTATAVTAARRSTWSATDAAIPTGLPRPCDILRFHAGLFPASLSVGTSSGPNISRLLEEEVPIVPWVERYDMRFIAGSMPIQWDGAEADSLSRLWVRDEPPRALDFVSLTALADTFFPRVWQRRAVKTPIGTVSMTVYYHAGAAELDATGTGYLLGQARSQAFFNGFYDQSAELWNEAGHLLVTSHQIAYFKE